MTLPATNPLIAGPVPDVSDIEIPGDGFLIKAHMARPQGVASAPAVVVIHARDGLLPAYRDAADELCAAATSTAPIWARAYENALKVAGIVAIGEADLIAFQAAFTGAR